jgi:diadenosine tetraphosphatase ApaH/serine/threonine PP2A family protein phosphatase
MNTSRLVEAILSNDSRGLTEASFSDLLEIAQTLFEAEPAVLKLSGDFAVVGDLHGDIASLTRIFQNFGYPPEQSYLFLGDYVDRGTNSCEVVCLLFALKVLFPGHVYLLRGNHENRAMTDVYGFREECLGRFSSKIYDKILTAFENLPIAAVLNDTVFCVHAGVPHNFQSTDSITKSDPPDLIDDLLWSDPSTECSWFAESPRGRGHLFGEKAVDAFLNRVNLRFIIRSHELTLNGYDYPFGPDGMLMTVFSSCDYMGQMNDGGVAFVGPGKITAEYFEPLTEKEKAQRRVILPPFLVDREPGMREIWTEFEMPLSPPNVLVDS